MPSPNPSMIPPMNDSVSKWRPLSGGFTVGLGCAVVGLDTEVVPELLDRSEVCVLDTLVLEVAEVDELMFVGLGLVVEGVAVLAVVLLGRIVVPDELMVGFGVVVVG